MINKFIQVFLVVFFFNLLMVVNSSTFVFENFNNDIIRFLKIKNLSIDYLLYVLLLMDIKMPEMDGIQTADYVHQHYKHIKILALSMFNEDKYIVDMMKAGASGYLLKNAEPEEIIEAISTVYHKGFYFNEHLSITLIKQLVTNEHSDNIPNNKADLNEREIEVLKLVCQEYSNQEIADKIFLSVRTVEGYRARLFEKTCSKNLVGLVIYAIKRGIISV